MVPLARPAPPLTAARRLAATHWLWAAAALFLAALALRLYHLGADPLWFDEVMSTLVVRRGLWAVFPNSLADPHPPLYYLLLWFTSGFGAAQTEWAWRWSSALAGAFSVPVLYALARRTTGDRPALIVAVWLVFNPTAVYFSQEARWPAVTLLLAILLTLVFSALLAAPARRRLWVVYGALAAWGLFTSYSFALLVGVQLPFLLWAVRRERSAWLLALTLLGSLALLAVLGATTLPAMAVRQSGTRPLVIKEIVQGLLVGDVFRYKSFWPHKFTVGLLGALAALGVWHRWRAAARWQGLYLLAQVAGPLAAYGLVASPLLHLNLPTYQTRQFLVVLPALYLLFAHGLAQVWARWPQWSAWGLSLVLSAVVIVGSIQGLARYWTVTRSPEGLAVQYVAPRLQPGDAVVALEYSSAVVLRYYLATQPFYAQPKLTDAGLRFMRPDGRLRFEPGPAPYDTTLAEVYAHPRLWVFSVPGRQDEYLAGILAGCQVQSTTDIAWLPVRVQLVTDCVEAAP